MIRKITCVNKMKSYLKYMDEIIKKWWVIVKKIDMIQIK